MKFSSIPYIFQLIIYSVLFAIITRIGLMFSYIPAEASQIWSPTGLSIVLLFISGPRILPAIFFGVVINYVTTVSSLPLGIMLAFGSTMEGYIGYILLKRAEFTSSLRRLRDVGTLIIISGGISTLANAFFSVAAAGIFTPELHAHYLPNVLIWTMGNISGVIIIAPLLFVMVSRRFERIEQKRIAEFMVMILMVYAVSGSIFHGKFFFGQLNYSLAFILFPFAIWATIRFGIVGSVITTFIIALNGTLSTQTGTGLFAAEPYSIGIILVDGFIIVLGSTSLALAALIEERTTAEHSIRRSEEIYRIVTERTGQLVYDYNIASGAVQWSGAIQDVTQHSPDEFADAGIERRMEMIHPDDRQSASDQWKRSMERHEEYNAEYRIRKKDGSYIDILDRGAFLYRHTADQTAYRMLGTMADISHVNLAMERLRESEERFRMLIEKSADGIMLLDKRGTIVFVSSSATSIIGYRPEELLQTSIFEILHPSESKKYTFKFGRLSMESERSEYLLGRFRHKNGEWVHIEGMVTNLIHHPSVNAFVANFRNVTERILSEDRLKRSLQEKEILLKEVHHRVKNNMQVISSLLNLQSASAKDAATVALFRDSRNRVKSMALVHEILYQSHDIASVNFSTYVKQLIASLQQSFTTGTGSVTIAVKVTNIGLDVDEAIPCGLIINELVSNALKYAFPKNRGGEIVIEVKRLRNAFIRLSVRDNGIGMKLKRTNSSTLGVKLVRALAEQLKGTVSFTVDHGTAWDIEFPLRSIMKSASV